MKRSIITLPDENFTKIQNIVIEQKKLGNRKASMNKIMNDAIEVYLRRAYNPAESYLSCLSAMHDVHMKGVDKE